MNWLNATHGIVETNDFETFPESVRRSVALIQILSRESTMTHNIKMSLAFFLWKEETVICSWI